MNNKTNYDVNFDHKCKLFVLGTSYLPATHFGQKLSSPRNLMLFHPPTFCWI